MAAKDRNRSPLRLGIYLWAAGLLGVIAVTVAMLPRMFFALPELTGEAPPPIGADVLMLISFVQTAMLLALAVWIGVALAHRVGLRAPMFEAAAAGDDLGPPLRPQLVPGLAGGVAGGVLLLSAGAMAPPSLRAAAERLDTPLLVRILYGGVTEEILIRWGLMTLLVWLLARLLRQGRPARPVIAAAIAASALVFAAGHLPLAGVITGGLTAPVVVYVLTANTLFGLIAGYLYWSAGLEAAMMAHILSHVIASVAA